MKVPDEFHDFAIASVSASAALIGLLFVAVSVFPDKGRRAATRVDYHTRASSALVVFLNAFMLSLAFLVPGSTVGSWAVVAGVVLFVFIAATTRVLVHEARSGRGSWDSLGLVFALLAADAVEIYAGVQLISGSSDVGHFSTLDYVVIAEFAIGVARSWQLVNMHDTGILSSLLVLTRGSKATEEHEQT